MSDSTTDRLGEVMITSLQAEKVSAHSTTVGKSKLAIDTAYKLWREGRESEITDDLLLDFLVGVNSEVLDIRDYVIGLPNESSVSDVADFLEIIGMSFPDGYKAPIYAVLSSFKYELGDIALANSYLTLSHGESKSDASNLIRLLARCYQAGWPASGFSMMRTELHSTVVDKILENSDLIIPLEE